MFSARFPSVRIVPILLLSMFLAVTGFLISKAHDRFVYPAVLDSYAANMDELGIIGEDRNSTATKNYRANEIQKMKPLFGADTPVGGIFGYCKNQNCYRPGWDAYESMRVWAARPASYESDVCRYLTGWTSMRRPSGVEPVFARDANKNNTCKLVNAKDLRAKAGMVNGIIFTMAVLLFSTIAIVAALFTGMLKVSLRPTRKEVQLP
jgi:hypothetical protein